MGKDKERITVRLSSTDLKGLDKIRASGDFEDISATVRWCIHFSGVLLKLIPSAIINSFVDTEEAGKEIKKDDSLEVPPQEVPKSCNSRCGNGNCQEK